MSSDVMNCDNVSFDGWISLTIENSLNFLDQKVEPVVSTRISNKVLPKVMTMSECMSIFFKLGFTIEEGRGKGSHYWLKDSTGRSFALPNRSDVPVKVLQKYIKQSGISREDFVKAMNF